jgi:hypothetical protein
LSVAGGVANLALPAPATTTSAALESVSASDVLIATTVSSSKVADGGGQYFSLFARWTDANHLYRGNVHILSSGVVQVYVTKLDGSQTEVTIGSAATISGLTYAPGMVLHVKFQVTGSAPTALTLKVWADGTPEPASPQVSATDTSTSLQAAGAVGFRCYLSGSATNAPVTISMGPFNATKP